MRSDEKRSGRLLDARTKAWLRDASELVLDTTTRLTSNPNQLQLLTERSPRRRAANLTRRLRGTNLGPRIEAWGATTYTDRLVVTLAFGGHLTSMPYWDPLLAIFFPDSVERLHAQLRIGGLREYINTRACGLSHFALVDLGMSEAPASESVQRVVPEKCFDDIHLSLETERKLRRFASRLKNAGLLDQWGFNATHRSSLGGVALFHGPPGCGKTLAAEVLAHELDLPLFSMRTDHITSKWVGETEKGIVKVFEEAASVPCVLFLDEADGLLAARTGISHSTDAFRNTEVTVLMRQLEARQAPTILATNHRQNLDSAAASRLSETIEFSLPTQKVRAAIWRAHIPTAAPLDSDVNFDRLAAFELSGRDIAQAVLSAAFDAAAGGRSIGQRDLEGAALERGESARRPVGFAIG